MNSLVLEQLFSGTSNKFWLYLHSVQVGAFIIGHGLITIWTNSVFFFGGGESSSTPWYMRRRKWISCPSCTFRETIWWSFHCYPSQLHSTPFPQNLKKKEKEKKQLFQVFSKELFHSPKTSMWESQQIENWWAKTWWFSCNHTINSSRGALGWSPSSCALFLPCLDHI